MRNALITLVKIAVTLILTGALIFGALFAFLALFCTGGGALVIMIPVAIVVLPIYFATLRFIWGKKKAKKPKSDNKQMTMTRNEIALVNYIIDARSAGNSDTEIKNQLLAVQWSGDEIDHAFGLAPLRQQ